MNTTSKRWNGQIDTLKADYLKQVMEQMNAYGDRVQFTLHASRQRPHYQVINSSDKKMAFDSNHHLLHPQDDEFGAGKVSAVFALDQIKTVAAGGVIRSSSGSSGGGRVARVASTRSTRSSPAAVKAKDLLDTEKYTYFKNNRDTLPATIGEHAIEVTDLMREGKSAEEAFGEVVRRHF